MSTASSEGEVPEELELHAVDKLLEFVWQKPSDPAAHLILQFLSHRSAEAVHQSLKLLAQWSLLGGVWISS
jgi:hypothetical protein